MIDYLILKVKQITKTNDEYKQSFFDTSRNCWYLREIFEGEAEVKLFVIDECSENPKLVDKKLRLYQINPLLVRKF